MSVQIYEILQFVNKQEFPKFSKEIIFESKLNNIRMKYIHPDCSDKNFLAIDFLSKRFMKYFSSDLIYKIIVSILSEESFIFVSDEIEILTSSVYLFF